MGLSGDGAGGSISVFGADGTTVGVNVWIWIGEREGDFFKVTKGLTFVMGSEAVVTGGWCFATKLATLIAGTIWGGKDVGMLWPTMLLPDMPLLLVVGCAAAVGVWTNCFCAFCQINGYYRYNRLY